LMILEVSFEILEVLILLVGQVLYVPGELMGGAVTESSAASYEGTCKKRTSPPESSAVATGRPANQDG
jgi:hypothetical protein